MPRAIMEPPNAVDIETERLAHEAEGGARTSAFNALLTGILLLFKKAGVEIGARPSANYLESSDIGWTLADDGVNNEVEITPTLKPTTVVPAAYTSANITVDAKGRITAAANGGTGGVPLTDGDKGDITVSGSGATFTIDADVVTYAKMQNVSATDKLLGRSTAGAGDPEEIPCTAAARSILDDASTSAIRTTLGVGTGDDPTFKDAKVVRSATEGVLYLGSDLTSYIRRNGASTEIHNDNMLAGSTSADSRFKYNSSNKYQFNPSNASGGGVFFGAATGSATPDAVISNNGGTEIASFSNTGVAALPGLRIAWATPAQITANQNDYNPGTGSAFRLSASAPWNITGFAGGTDGRQMWIVNVGAQNIVLTNQDALSAAASRIITGTGASVTLAADDTAVLAYDGTTARWRLIT